MCFLWFCPVECLTIGHGFRFDLDMKNVFTPLFVLLLISAAFAAYGQNGGRKGGNDTTQVQSIAAKEKQKRPRAQPVAEEGDFFYIGDNLISALHHEIGHALIEILNLPVLGQEEDAADVLAALLLDVRGEPALALRVAQNAALSIRQDASDAERNGRKWEMWDEHGPDMQRYYNLVCLVFGADPNRRKGFAREMDLPDIRAEGCREEYDVARRGWGRYLDDMATQASQPALVLHHDADTAIDRRAVAVLSGEIDAFNQIYGLNTPIDVFYETCEEDAGMGAYYTVGTAQITICQEYTHRLARFDRRR